MAAPFHQIRVNGSFLLFLLIIPVFFSQKAKGQSPLQPPAISDTTRLIQILKGNSLREKNYDTVAFQTIAGEVVLKEGMTLFYCDSAAINKNNNILEAFGRVHINQHDSIHTYAKYVKYIGKERIAYLKNNVELTDKKGTLYTQDLLYDLKTNIGTYSKGGRVVNGKTVLTSNEGVYYADTKDVYFKKKVRLKDPKYDIDTDSLLYNTATQVVTFITETHIRSRDGADIYTTSGFYDLKNGKAFFGSRTLFKDSTRTYIADRSAYDDTSQTAQLEGNAIIQDSVNGYTVIGNQIFLNKKNNSFLATQKPVLIFKGEGNDSTYVAADTLFSGVMIPDKAGGSIVQRTDTIQHTVVVNSDSTLFHHSDSTEYRAPSSDTMHRKPEINDQHIPILDTGAAVANHVSIHSSKRSDTTEKTILRDSLIRFFQAFRHVRIYNDSVQAVCDSLYCSSLDSVFRLYREPVVFSKKSQIAGDTIHLYTKNKKADRVYVFDNGMIINQLNPKMYNQIGGRTLNGLFKNGSLDYMRVKGSPAESIFYPQDEDSAITGMNRCHGDVVDIYFVDQAVNKVKFINQVEGVLYPLNQIPEEEKKLSGFKWLDARRPKNKLELFE